VASHEDDKSNSAKANKAANALKAAAAGKETATMTLRGYPRLKAKATVEVTGVGAGSGKWYCKTVVQEWSVERGYISNAQMLRGGGGGGGSGGGQPGGNTPIGSPND
jgi:phage protein D